MDGEVVLFGVRCDSRSTGRRIECKVLARRSWSEGGSPQVLVLVLDFASFILSFFHWQWSNCHDGHSFVAGRKLGGLLPHTTSTTERVNGYQE